MSRLWLAAGLLAMAGLAISGIYLTGRSVGRAVVVERLKDDRIRILRDGKDIDDEVSGADDGALCQLLGGCRLPEPIGGR